jgi:hypothetical protein
MLYISIELQLIFLCYSELQTVYEVMGLGRMVEEGRGNETQY